MNLSSEDKRRIVALTFLEIESSVLLDARTLVRGTPYPFELLMPAVNTPAREGDPPPRLEHVDLKTFFRQIQMQVVRPPIYKYFDAEARYVREDALEVQRKGGTEIVAKYFQRYKETLKDAGLPVLFDNDISNHIYPELMQSNCKQAIETALFTHVAQEAANRLDQKWDKLRMQKGVTIFPSSDLTRTARNAVVSMTNDYERIVAAFDVWGTVKRTLLQRKCWLNEIRAGLREPFDYARNYANLTLQPSPSS